MPTSRRETVLCRYQYDPLDRQAGCTSYDQAKLQRFYCKNRLTTEIQDAVKRSIFQYDNRLLAQQQSEDEKFNAVLLAIDHQRSILSVLDGTQPYSIAYTPYGHRPQENGLLSLLGFNGEQPDPVTGHYHLGNGYRQFNPVLMRFNSPDSWSPFGDGGLNAYAYCGGDPRNLVDESGHAPVSKAMDQFLRNLVTGVSRKSKAISRPLAASDDVVEVASSSSATASKREAKRLLKCQREKTRLANYKKLSKLIEANEASQPVQSRYNVSADLRDIKSSEDAYNHAKHGYGFKKYPDPNQPHYWIGPHGESLLDVAHFDVTISHFRNRAAKKVTSSSYGIVYQLKVKRAEYIKKFTEIDLMTIRG